MGSALALAVGLTAAVALAGGAQAQTGADSEARPGPRVMLCLYGTDGKILAGHIECPEVVHPTDAMMAAAHCFYDREGRLWRGLPRCPRTAPPFLMEEAAHAE
ncbi:hypothetical protein [Roseospira navarrensis]|uniref:Uncharacterized protein n=1 Tax=Roseospira navarrensis TaxID=140058 RepID=A0A7X1ZG85_9PROT|nr:hypothetical protein [Roseospira navarrensis]MQX37994.1 hypothetical protein [Roseospira navarrensis]